MEEILIQIYEWFFGNPYGVLVFLEVEQLNVDKEEH
jgi:hypothetical protein